MDKVLIDSSIFIDFSRAKKGVLPELFRDAAKGEISLYTSSVVVFEFWSGVSINLKSEEENANKLFAGVKILDFSTEIAKIAGSIRRNLYTPDFDSLIAATAIYHDCMLATQNKKHFQNIPSLQLWQ